MKLLAKDKIFRKKKTLLCEEGYRVFTSAENTLPYDKQFTEPRNVSGRQSANCAIHEDMESDRRIAVALKR